MDLISDQLFDQHETKLMDENAWKKQGIPEEVLMGMACQSLYLGNADLWSLGSSIWIFCGSGGNGGDGYGLGYLLRQAGFNVVIWEEKESKKKASSFYRNLAKEVGVPFHSFADFLRISLGTSTLEIPKKHSVICVDALLGTGTTGELKKDLAQLVNELNRTEIFQYRISVDLPSGYCKGNSLYFKPDRIHELGTRKWENIGFAIHGRFIQKVFSPLGFSLDLFSDLPKAKIWNPLPLSKIKLESERIETGHKYKSGSAIFIGGESGFSGAIVLAQSAFQGFGGGISKIYSPSEETRNFSLLQDPSRMVQGLEFLESDGFVDKAKVIVLGPGTRNLDFFPWGKESKFLGKWLVLDAGAGDPKHIDRFSQCKILFTPHSGEFERLVGKKPNSISVAKDMAREFCREKNVNILYKGYVSFLCEPSGKIHVWEKPNSKLAVMGTGDILAGTLARFLAKDYPLIDSVHYSLSLFDTIAKEGNSYPTAWEILESLKGKL